MAENRRESQFTFAGRPSRGPECESEGLIAAGSLGPVRHRATDPPEHGPFLQPRSLQPLPSPARRRIGELLFLSAHGTRTAEVVRRVEFYSVPSEPSIQPAESRRR